MTDSKLQIGDRVEAGEGEEHDVGTILELGAGGLNDDHVMAQDGNAYVAWDSGTRTWTPVSDLEHA